MNRTWQHELEQYFSGPKAELLAHAFAVGCEAQTNIKYEVSQHGETGEWSVNLEAWPNGHVGDWFDTLMGTFQVTVA